MILLSVKASDSTKILKIIKESINLVITLWPEQKESQKNKCTKFCCSTRTENRKQKYRRNVRFKIKTILPQQKQIEVKKKKKMAKWYIK